MRRPYRDEWKLAQPEVLSHAFDVTMWSPIEEFRPPNRRLCLRTQGKSATLRRCSDDAVDASVTVFGLNVPVGRGYIGRIQLREQIQAPVLSG